MHQALRSEQLAESVRDWQQQLGQGVFDEATMGLLAARGDKGKRARAGMSVIGRGRLQDALQAQGSSEALAFSKSIAAYTDEHEAAAAAEQAAMMARTGGRVSRSVAASGALLAPPAAASGTAREGAPASDLAAKDGVGPAAADAAVPPAVVESAEQVATAMARRLVASTIESAGSSSASHGSVSSPPAEAACAVPTPPPPHSSVIALGPPEMATGCCSESSASRQFPGCSVPCTTAVSSAAPSLLAAKSGDASRCPPALATAPPDSADVHQAEDARSHGGLPHEPRVDSIPAAGAVSDSTQAKTGRARRGATRKAQSKGRAATPPVPVPRLAAVQLDAVPAAHLLPQPSMPGNSMHPAMPISNLASCAFQGVLPSGLASIPMDLSAGSHFGPLPMSTDLTAQRPAVFDDQYFKRDAQQAYAQVPPHLLQHPANPQYWQMQQQMQSEHHMQLQPHIQSEQRLPLEHHLQLEHQLQLEQRHRESQHHDNLLRLLSRSPVNHGMQGGPFMVGGLGGLLVPNGTPLASVASFSGAAPVTQLVHSGCGCAQTSVSSIGHAPGACHGQEGAVSALQPCAVGQQPADAQGVYGVPGDCHAYGPQGHSKGAQG